MKKAFAILVLFAIMLPLFAGCRRIDLTMSQEPLPEEAKALIKEKIETEDELIVDWDATDWYAPYYGTIDGFSIIQASKGPLPNNTGYTGVAGYGFKAEGYFFELYAYREGKVYTLYEVYKNGWLTKEQIGIIHERHQQIHAPWFEEVAGWPSEFDPDVYFKDTFLDEKKEKMTALLLTQYSKEIDWDNACRYMGIVNGFDVFMILSYGLSVGEVYFTLEIADLKFQWDVPFEIYLHRDGTLYKLKEAYEKGWLTKDHVAQILKAHNEAYGEWRTKWD